MFLACILEFFNNHDKDLFYSQEEICTMLLKMSNPLEWMSQVTPAHESDVRTERPWAHSSYGAILNATLLLGYRILIVYFLPGFPLPALGCDSEALGLSTTRLSGIMSHCPAKHSRLCEEQLVWSDAWSYHWDRRTDNSRNQALCILYRPFLKL